MNKNKLLEFQREEYGYICDKWEEMGKSYRDLLDDYKYIISLQETATKLALSVLEKRVELIEKKVEIALSGEK